MQGIGFVLETQVQLCKGWIDRCLELGESFGLENKYPQFYLQAGGLLLAMQGHYINRSTFEQLNGWFCCFCNGLEDYDM